MIASLSGVVAEMTGTALVLDVAGVGYLVHAPAGVLAGARPGDRVRLLTHLVVREDAMNLYGFRTTDQRDLFQTLIGVTGVGPKVAVAVLSVFEPDGLRRAVAAGDVDALTSVPGVGRRGAQRMLLELRDRLDIVAAESMVSSSDLAEVRAALVGLGYAPAELRGVMERVVAPGASVEDMVRAALKELSAGRTVTTTPRAPGPPRTRTPARTSPARTSPARTSSE